VRKAEAREAEAREAVAREAVARETEAREAEAREARQRRHAAMPRECVLLEELVWVLKLLALLVQKYKTDAEGRQCRRRCGGSVSGLVVWWNESRPPMPWYIRIGICSTYALHGMRHKCSA
jgi:hypothetical protein